MTADFKLSDNVIECLKLLNSKINPEITKKLLINAAKQTLISGLVLPPKSDLYENNADLSKQADFGICSLLIVSAKYDIEIDELRIYLKEKEINGETIDQLIEILGKYKTDIRTRLQQIGNGHNLSHLTNCTWELNYNVKSNDSSSAQSELEYKINFQSFDQKSGKPTTITEFHCNPEELTFLISKLKDIERHCEKTALNK